MHVKVEGKKKTIVKHGKNSMTAASRGEKRTTLTKQTSKASRPSYKQVKYERDLKEDFKKYNVTFDGSKESVDTARSTSDKNQVLMAGSITIPLKNGGKVIVNSPHDPTTGQYHGHEYDRQGNEVGAENADGSKHDGKRFTNKTRQELKSNNKWQEIKKRNEELKRNRQRQKDKGNNNAKAAIAVGGIVVVGVGAYEVIKWGAAVAAAPETLGGSLIIAGAMP